MTENALTGSALRAIWIHPRRTLREILSVNPKHYVLLLAALIGIKGMFDGIVQSEPLAAENIGSIEAFVIALIAGPILGIGMVYLYAWLYKLTGRWFGGVGTVRTLATAVAWGSVPVVAVLPLDVIASFVLPHGALVIHSAPTFAGLTGIAGWTAPSLVHATDILASLWGFVLTLHTIGEANGYSAWITLVNMIVLAIVLFVVLLLGAMILGALIALL